MIGRVHGRVHGRVPRLPFFMIKSPASAAAGHQLIPRFAAFVASPARRVRRLWFEIRVNVHRVTLCTVNPDRTDDQPVGQASLDYTSASAAPHGFLG